MVRALLIGLPAVLIGLSGCGGDEEPLSSREYSATVERSFSVGDTLSVRIENTDTELFIDLENPSDG